MAGISILRRLLMKEAMKKNAPFQNEGIMSISKALTTNVDSKVNKIVEGAKRQGIDFDKYNEEQVKYILELNKKKLEPRVISADSPEGRGITEALLGRKEGKVIKADFGKPFAKEVESMQDIADARLIKDMYRTAGPRNLDEDAGYLAEFIAEDAGKIFDDLPAEQQRAFRLRARKALRKNVEKYKKFPTAKDPDFEDVGPFDNDAEKLAEIKMSNEGFIDDIISEVNDMETISAMKEVNKVIKREGKYKNLTDEDVDKIFKGTEDRTAGRLDDIDPEDLATGGRVGLKAGMSKRAFLKLMGGAAAGIGALKTGALKMFGKGAAPVAEKTAEAASGAPSYFFDLVNKIKILGKEGRSISPRKKTINYKNYELEEDLTTGDLVVTKQKGDPDFAYEEEVMVLRKGQADETTKGKTPPDEYEELTIRPDGDGKMKDVDSGIEPEGIKEIMEEVSGEAPSIKKAGGGRVGLLSGGGVIRVMLKKLAERYGKKPSELLAITNYKSLPVEVRKFSTKEKIESIKKDMQSRRVEQFENLRDMIKSRQEFDRSAEALKKMGMDISDTMLPIMNKGVTPGGTTADDLLMMEQVIKNLRMKDRKLNASGGLAGMLGE